MIQCIVRSCRRLLVRMSRKRFSIFSHIHLYDICRNLSGSRHPTQKPDTLPVSEPFQQNTIPDKCFDGLICSIISVCPVLCSILFKLLLYSLGLISIGIRQPFAAILSIRFFAASNCQVPTCSNPLLSRKTDSFWCRQPPPCVFYSIDPRSFLLFLHSRFHPA